MHLRTLSWAGSLALAWTLVANLGGCATVTAAKAPVPQPRDVPIYRAGTGARAAWGEVLEAASHADVVLIGETHGHSVGLPTAAALWDDLAAKSPKAALALEFFERDQQSAIDDYLSGLTDEKQFLATSRHTNPANYPAGHKQMVETAKRLGLPVMAANAPRSYVRASRASGYDKLAGLTPEQKRMFRVPDAVPTADNPYRQAFEKVMGGGEDPKAKEMSKDHKVDPAMVESMFRAQTLWDWTMAESVARSLDADRRPTLLVVGRFHVENNGGLRQALHQMHPDAKVVSVVFVDDTSASLKSEDAQRGDFVVYVGPSEGE